MQSNKASYGLRGPVRSVQIELTKFEGEDNQRIEKPWYGYTVSFNPEGKMVEYVHRNPDGSTWRSVNEYSPAGKLVSTKDL